MLAQTVLDSQFGVPFFAILVVFALSTFWPLARLPFSKMFACFSVLIIPLWAWYEYALPSDMNIRVDLFVLLPLAALSAILLAVRMPWVLENQSSTDSNQ